MIFTLAELVEIVHGQRVVMNGKLGRVLFQMQIMDLQIITGPTVASVDLISYRSPVVTRDGAVLSQWAVCLQPHIGL